MGVLGLHSCPGTDTVRGLSLFSGDISSWNSGVTAQARARFLLYREGLYIPSKSQSFCL